MLKCVRKIFMLLHWINNIYEEIHVNFPTQIPLRVYIICTFCEDIVEDIYKATINL